MPKLSDIEIDMTRFKGNGIRPWNDPKVVKPPQKEIDTNTTVKREQSVSKALANREQTVSKALANREQNSPKKTESVSKALAEPLATPLAKREQSVSKALANTEKRQEPEILETLVGKEKELLYFLFQKCQLTGSLESPAITTDDLKNLLKIKAEHLRNLIYRISKKGLIDVSIIKNGRAGWRKFKLSKEIFQSISLDQTVSKALANREQTVSKALAKPLAEPLASFSSSSSIYNNIKTTTTGDEVAQKKFILSNEWKEIDFECLERVGFTATHLAQIASQNILTPELVQNSIYAYSFDLNHNNKEKNIKGSPLNYFVGILRKGQPYTYPSNYESPKERYMRLYAEKTNEVKQRQIAVEKEALNLSFNEWFEKLPEEMLQKLNLVPIGMKNNKHSKMVESMAKEYFSKEIWPSKKAEIEQGLIGNKNDATEVV